MCEIQMLDSLGRSRDNISSMPTEQDLPSLATDQHGVYFVVCSNCNGQKQKWSNDLKMMEDCIECGSKGYNVIFYSYYTDCEDGA